MKPIKAVSIIGAGAMGAAYASILYDFDRQGVHFIAGRSRRDQLENEGLIVNGTYYSIPVVTPEDRETPPDDMVIVAVKFHQLTQAIEDMKNRVGPDTIIMSVMNGIDSEEQIGAVFGMDKVLYAISVGIDAIREGNQVTYTNQGKIFFGEPRNEVLSEKVLRVKNLFDQAGIICEVPEDMIRMLWWKFMINVGVNQASAALKATYGVFQESPEARELSAAAMREVIRIANAEGVDLSEGDIEAWNQVLSRLSPAGKTSMLQDVEAGRKTEVEMFAGRVMTLGRKHGIATPVNEKLFKTIRDIERQEIRK
jgi:2-dehydropantoate 2-reductase